MFVGKRQLERQPSALKHSLNPRLRQTVETPLSHLTPAECTARYMPVKALQEEGSTGGTKSSIPTLEMETLKVHQQQREATEAKRPALRAIHSEFNINHRHSDTKTPKSLQADAVVQHFRDRQQQLMNNPQSRRQHSDALNAQAHILTGGVAEKENSAPVCRTPSSTLLFIHNANTPRCVSSQSISISSCSTRSDDGSDTHSEHSDLRPWARQSVSSESPTPTETAHSHAYPPATFATPRGIRPWPAQQGHSDRSAV
eukprot:NODE_1480_length_936_cov_62.357384_g1147_i0.p1 GENE.NODE_1480_length_936_cov_62.357384_g1147_i0~~NODE_1480_length_936_cov_62.357384_g1147_i0.p1  ORF type:complete len:257 (-),score=47.82 NODE_1480_length_936_cov_62.357384_g1147_i0:63-833(-)